MVKSKNAFANELSALTAVLGALEPLDTDKQSFVLRTVMDRLKLAVGRGTPPSNETLPPGTDPGTATNDNDLSRKTPKEFLRGKQPMTDAQRVACLAYYLSRARSTAHFKTVDLTKLNTEAAGTRFSNPTVAVNNATLTGLLAPAGGGKKQITALGEEVTEALPDQERVKAIVATAKKGRGRRGRPRMNKKANRKA
jgi:hypothetical protein